MHNWVICQVYCSQTIKLSVRSIAEVATDPERAGSDSNLTVFSWIPIGSESSFIKRCGSRSEFGFALPNNLGTKSALFRKDLSFFWSPPKFWQKKCPNFQWRLFYFFGPHLKFGRKNAPIFSEDLVFAFCYSPKFGYKKRPSFYKDLFFWSSPEFGQKKTSNFDWGPFLLFFSLLLVFVDMNKV